MTERKAPTKPVDPMHSMVYALTKCQFCSGVEGSKEYPNGFKFLRCGCCKFKPAIYCSAACQRADWKDHKPDCKKAQAFAKIVLEEEDPKSLAFLQSMHRLHEKFRHLFDAMMQCYLSSENKWVGDTHVVVFRLKSLPKKGYPERFEIDYVDMFSITDPKWGCEDGKVPPMFQEIFYDNKQARGCMNAAFQVEALGTDMEGEEILQKFARGYSIRQHDTLQGDAPMDFINGIKSAINKTARGEPLGESIKWI